MLYRQQYASLWALLLCLWAVHISGAASSATVKGQCKPQGLLLLDKPYPRPRRVELPFCQQYGCSCCNASHALTLQRASRVIAEDEDLSRDCKLGLLRLACRVCDPEVATGVKTHICADTCRSLYQACAQDFFAYDASNGFISPCSEQSSGMLVCSQLTDLVSSAADFCKAAGFGSMAKAAAADEPCFDGSPVGAEVCPAEPPASTQHSTHSTPQQQQQPRQRRKSKASHLASDPVSRLLALLPWKLKRRHKQQLAVAAELLIGVTMSGLMAWGVVLVLQRVMQPTGQNRRRPAGPPPSNVREMLARAAEARSQAGNKRA